MAAYVIAEVDVKDAAAFDEYRKLVPATIEKYGGRYLVRGGEIESREGGWSPPRLVIVEFPSLARAKEWYDSPEYAHPLDLRKRASNSKLIIAEGL